MRKKFTMLLALLLTCVGAWAQTVVVGLSEVPTTPVTDLESIETGYYLIKEVSASTEANGEPGGFMKAASESNGAVVTPQGRNNALEAANVDATYIWYIEKGDATYTIATANKVAAWQSPWQGQKNLVAYANKGELAFVTEAAVGSQAITADEGSFVVQNAAKTACVHYSGGKLGSWTDVNSVSLMMFEFYLIPDEDLDVRALVDLTVEYKYDGNVVGTTTLAEQTVGEDCTIPALDFTSVVSCAIGEAEATEGATIVVPDAATTITVNLADNLPFTVSESYETATWYVLNIRGSQNVVNNGTSISSNAAWTASDGALWAFMGNPFDGIQVLNKAAGEGKTLALGSGAQMLDGTTKWNILKNGNGFILREGTTGNNCLNDVNNTLSSWGNDAALTDAGSTFIVKAEATVVSEAVAVLSSMNATISSAESTEATYFVYSDAAAAAAKAKVEGLDTPTDFLTALQARAKVAEAQTALGSKSGAPAAGDYVRFKNRSYPVYLATTDNTDNVIRKSDDATDLKAIWQVEAGDNGSVLLKNVGTEKYMGSISQSANVLQVEADNAAQFTFSGIGDVYGRFQVTGGNNYTFANMNEWDGTYKLVGWLAGEGNHASHWVMTQAYPLTVVYNYNGEELTELAVDTYADAGSTYTIANPYANKYVSAEISVNGTPVEDGAWSVEVTANTEITVTYTDALPFKASADYETAVWNYLQVNSNNWKFMKKTETATATTNAAGLTVDDAQWAFVGNAIDGFKIYNKAAGSTHTLAVDATDNGTAAYMKEGETTWTIEKGNGGFIIRQGAQECLNDYANAGVLKIYNDANAPTGTGSAFKAITASGVTDLTNLSNGKVYVLQAERSPLLYSTTEGKTTKLSSGLVDGVGPNIGDANQHFLILRGDNTPDGLYYLYSMGAQKFVAADLTFSDFPEPVLSFEAYTGTNSAVYPWWVKIGDKYVIPGSNGTAGNKLFHTEDGDDDDGKRYRIEEVGTPDMDLAVNLTVLISGTENLVKSADELSNDKVYTVSTYDCGSWYYNSEQTALWSTTKAGVEFDGSETQQFAFLTVSGKTFLYSVGAQKFVTLSEPDAENHTYTAYSDTPVDAVELLAAEGDKFYPIVVSLAGHHMGISNGYETPVITFWNDLGDSGNKVRIEPVGTLDEATKTELLAKIENFLVSSELVPELETLVADAQAILDKNYLDTEDAAALTTAKDAAQAVLDLDAPTSDQLTAQVESLTAAIAAVTYVTEIDGFKNAYVYTFVSKRGWMGADDTDGVISGTGTADDTNYQWAVYKSEKGYSYLYNIGKGQFMGVETINNTQMPFSKTPQTTGLTFKKSAWDDYPIMFSMDNQYVVNNNAANAMICWTGGWNKLNDDGSNHKVTIVGALDEEILNEIAVAVELYEAQVAAIEALDAAIAAAQTKVDGQGEGLGYYSTTNANAAADLETVKTFRQGITSSTTVDDINAQTAAAEAITASYTLNVPVAGKFYRIKNNGGTGYLSGDAATSGRVQFVADIEESASSVFYFTGTQLLSYSTGLYLAKGSSENFVHYTQTVGEDAGTTFVFKAAPVAGKLLIEFMGSRSFYSDGVGASNAASIGQTSDNYRFTVEEVTTLPVTVTSAGYATLYAPVALEIPAEGVDVYTAKVTETSVVITEMEGNVIPANTGVILEAGENTYNFNITTAAAAEGVSSEFVGSYAKSNMKDGVKTYTLQNGTNGVGFYRFNGTKPINGFRAWVELSEDSQVQSLRITRGDEEDTTGIESVEANEEVVIYDLAGRRVEKMEKGIYIVNGKKVIK